MKRLMLMTLLAIVVGCTQVESRGAAELQVSDAWSRAIAPGAPVAAGFLTIHNPGTSADRLVSVQTDAAERVEIHEASDDDGVARMRQLANGLPLPAGATVALAPGGHHLMLIGPRQPFTAGQRINATLTFEHAPAAEVSFEVRGPSGQPATTRPQADAEPGHDHH